MSSLPFQIPVEYAYDYNKRPPQTDGEVAYVIMSLFSPETHEDMWSLYISAKSTQSNISLAWKEALERHSNLVLSRIGNLDT